VAADAQNTDDPGVELVRKVLDAFTSRDVDRLIDLTSRDCVIVALRSRTDGAYEGRDGVRMWMEGFYALIPDAEVTVDRIIKTGRDEVVVLGHQSGSAPTGGAFDAPLAAVAQHAEGKLDRMVLFETHEEAIAASGGAA
jgi:ketosteroid isomerase-like protein